MIFFRMLNVWDIMISGKPDKKRTMLCLYDLHENVVLPCKCVAKIKIILITWLLWILQSIHNFNYFINKIIIE